MNKMIILSLLLVLAAGLYFLPTLLPISESSSVITIDEKDKYCQTDDDCYYVKTTCESCQCFGEPVNEAYVEKYDKIREANCINSYPKELMMCRNCEHKQVVCTKNKCDLVAKEASIRIKDITMKKSNGNIVILLENSGKTTFKDITKFKAYANKVTVDYKIINKFSSADEKLVNPQENSSFAPGDIADLELDVPYPKAGDKMTIKVATDAEGISTKLITSGE